MRKALTSFLFLLLFAACTTLWGEQRYSIFTSPDGTFQLAYPSYMVPCTLQRDGSSWAPKDCMAYIPLCSGSQAESYTACFAYPKSRFKQDPTFGAAAFSAAEIDEFPRKKIACKPRTS